MTDQAVVTMIPPLTCTGSSCLSYFIPGPITVVKFDSNSPPIGKDNFSDATAFIVNDAPGYQIEYSPVTSEDPPLLEIDCQMYGMPFAALLICVKQVGNSMIGGALNHQDLNIELILAVNACPTEIARKFSCINTTEWTNNPPFQYKITITKRRATTVFDRYNYTILDTLNLAGDWEPTNYGPDDYFPIFNDVFAVDISEPGWNISTQLDFLTHTWSYFINRINTSLVTGADEGLVKVRSLFAVPILEFNNVVYGGPLPDDLGKSISLATVSYRVFKLVSDLMRRLLFGDIPLGYLRSVGF